MEDVEQRRERLAAMREQAALHTDNVAVPTLPPPFSDHLLPSNPLENSGADSAPGAAEMKGSVFDFYTDPLAGFSSSKRRRPGSADIRTPRSAAPQVHPVVAFPPSDSQPAAIYPPLAPPTWQPIPYHPPVPLGPGFAHHPQDPPTQYYPQPPPHYMHQFPNPAYGQGPARGWGARDLDRGSPSGPSGGRGFPASGTGGREYPPDSPGRGGGGRGYSSDSPGRGGGGRGYLPDSPGRGRGGRGYIAPTARGGRTNSWSGRSPAGNYSRENANRSAGGRGQSGGTTTTSAREQPHLFFKKSMMEDPWQRLQASREETT